MKIRRGMGGFLGVALFLLLWGTSSGIWAESGDLLSKFHPYINVREQYSNNINLSHSDKKSDFITTVTPGLRFTTSEKTYGMDFDFNGGYTTYAKGTAQDYTTLHGNVNGWYASTPRLTFRLREYVIRSDQLREPDYSATAIPGTELAPRAFKTTPYIRNVVEPSIEYQYGKKEDLISIHYRNNTYNIQSQAGSDSMENFINPKLTYWFDIKNGISLDYGLTLGDFQRSPGLVGHMATGRYTYRFSPKTSIFGEYTQMWRNFEEPGVDYLVYRPSIGLEHAFSSTLSSRVQLGYYSADPKQGSSKGGPFYDVLITQQTQRTTYTLAFQGGFMENFFTVQNFGFTQYNRVIGTIHYQLLRKMNIGLFTSYGWYKYNTLEQAVKTEDRLWTISGNVSYQILKWLTIALDLTHRQNNPNGNTLSYSEYRGMLSITATYNN